MILLGKKEIGGIKSHFKILMNTLTVLSIFTVSILNMMERRLDVLLSETLLIRNFMK